MSTEYDAFRLQCKKDISIQGADANFKEATKEWLKQSIKHRYCYNFECFGRPIIQYPQDIIATQEIIYTVKPDLIIETGIAHGGSLVSWASQLCLLDLAEGLNPRETSRKVLGIDIDIRLHNRKEIESNPFNFKIDMVQGSSIDQKIVEYVHNYSKQFKNILLLLDSNHSHKHVLDELNFYSDLVSLNSYCIVFDTFIENFPKGTTKNRPWDKGDNPMTALDAFLTENDSFIADKYIDDKLLISSNPNGYLKRIK